MNTSIYPQIKESLKTAILTGRIMPGQRLPSVRKLAKQFQTIPNTVQRATTELCKTGLVTRQLGQPMIVISNVEQIEASRQKKAIIVIQECIRTLKKLNYQEEEIINLISLAVAQKSKGWYAKRQAPVAPIIEKFYSGNINRELYLPHDGKRKKLSCRGRIVMHIGGGFERLEQPFLWLSWRHIGGCRYAFMER